jgi:thiol-disulfide isomerase/thioredoxin
MRFLPILLPALLVAAFLAPRALRAEEPVNHANPGQTVDLKSVMSPGRITLVDFFSKYCPPCMRMSPLLEQLGQKRSDLKVVKLDINRPETKGIDWQSPLAQQYALRSIPHFKIYDADGKLLKQGDLAFEQVLEWLREAKLIN